MATPIIVFDTTSDIEASVIVALLDSHGIDSFRISGHTQATWPMSVNSLGPIRIAVAEDEADTARRVKLRRDLRTLVYEAMTDRAQHD